MTRKDYELIAAVLAGSKPDGSRAMLLQWQTTAENMADALAADNPRFDRVRFLAVCGVE
jgi:hypothetical protein